MNSYSPEVCDHMKAFYDSLSEKDRRRYAAVEAEKLGHRGVDYIAQVLDCDEKTIRQGRSDVEHLPHDEASGRVRKKGGPEETGCDQDLCRSSQDRDPTHTLNLVVRDSSFDGCHWPFTAHAVRGRANGQVVTGLG